MVSADGVLVLASGGIDSTTLLALLGKEQAPIHAMFVDYGQGPARAEASAAATLCSQLNVALTTVTYAGKRFGSGEIRGRNAFLVQAALLEFPSPAGTIAIGIHAGTRYRDCSPGFVDLMQRSLDFHTGGSISIAAPFIKYTKRDILALARDLGVCIELTHSCEASDLPCGECLSCFDRVALGVEGPW